ncbi:YlqD family protein [Actinomycetes bacterium NPDC127524]|uniref:YlqD family protein n=1 Tax=Bacillus sp. OV322 TaxID=1882764 RepID=UPI0008F0CB3F|nr:YlqD family protein [Bacillus sp. OV322]SFC06579.1 YlqD protein [Bacillus sp. OV322]
MKILQNVIVNQVLTESSKNKLLEKYKTKRLQLQKEAEQLRFELKKLEKTRPIQPATLRSHFEKEINQRQEKIKLVEFQIEQLDILPIGSELKEREVQSIIEVEIGADWEETIGTKTIVVKDGVVSEIR